MGSDRGGGRWERGEGGKMKDSYLLHPRWEYFMRPNRGCRKGGKVGKGGGREDEGQRVQKGREDGKGREK